MMGLHDDYNGDPNDEHLVRAVARIGDLTDLVKWLALPYGDNSPQFATATWEGAPLEDGRRLAAVYESVVGETRPPVPTAWTQCPTCGMWQTIPVVPT